jgi:SAM-dependent methyltransferase
MGIADRLKRFLGWRDSDAAVIARMRRDWNDRARENARHYVASGRENWTDEDFFESGQVWLREYVLPDLELICGALAPSEVRMLEVGCGAGRMTKAFSELFGSVDAVDISAEMTARAAAALGNRSNVRFHVNNGRDLSMFGPFAFDFVFSGIVFQHIPRKAIVENYIREASRVLRPGGVFKFQVQGVPIREDEADTWVGVGFTEEEMRSISVQCGFQICSMRGAGTQYFWLVFRRL